MKTLSDREHTVIRTHVKESQMVDGVRIRQWEGAWSVYYSKSGRLWVHNDDTRKQSFQELYFYSRPSVVGTLTCSHPIKLWDEQRYLTPRETARLQGFPDAMHLPDTQYQRLFGNAVAVPCAAYALSRVCRRTEKIRHIDMCAGVGGFSFALASVVDHPTCVGFSEVMKAAIRCYTKNFPSAPALGDAHTAAWPECDLLTAGFPCQPYSGSNTPDRRVSHKHRDFYTTVLDAVQRSRATRVVLENVMSIQTLGAHVLERVTRTLQDWGFRVSHQVLDSIHSSLPQRRQRLYIVASKVRDPLPWDRPVVASPATLDTILEVTTQTPAARSRPTLRSKEVSAPRQEHC